MQVERARDGATAGSATVGSTGGPLTVDRIRDEALALVEAEGFAALTLRPLAERLGVWPTAVSHHVGDKAGLVQVVLDGILGQLDIPDVELPWDRWYRAFGHRAYELLVRYPGVADHLEVHGNTSPEALAVADRGVAVLLRGGFSVEQAALLYANVFILVLASVRRAQRSGTGGTSGAGAAMLDAIERQDDYPNLHAALPVWRSLPPKAYLTYGLDALLAGAERLRGPHGQ